MLKSANIRPEDFNHLPCHVFIKDKRGIYLYSNDYVSEELGININSNDFLESSDFDFFTEKCASFCQFMDKKVYTSEIPEKFQEGVEFKLGLCYKAKTYKRPFHNFSNKVIGILGFTYYIPVNGNNSIKNLSEREIMCAKQMVYGKTSKEIAKCLNISHRTVEFHIANIKSKLNCYRRSEIIEKIFPHDNNLFLL